MLDHRIINNRHQRKVEYRPRFDDYGPADDMWIEDVNDGPDVVQDNWDSRPVTERPVLQCALHTGHLLLAIDCTHTGFQYIHSGLGINGLADISVYSALYMCVCPVRT